MIPRQSEIPHDPSASRGRFPSTVEPTPRILVAVALDGPSAIALQRADELAQTFAAELYAVHVLPAARPINRLFSRKEARKTLEALGTVRAAMDATHQFCELMLARPFPREHVMVRRADVVDVANELDADLVVVGAGRRGRPSRRTRTILRRARRPVLIARAKASSNAIVAATDFSDETFPALTRAAELGARLRAPVTFVHNLDWSTALAPMSFLTQPIAGASIHDATAHRRARLLHLAERLGEPIDAVILDRGSVTDAILEVARLRDADLVVVGAHPRRALGPLTVAGRAETIAAATNRSVLAVPLGEGAAAA